MTINIHLLCTRSQPEEALLHIPGFCLHSTLHIRQMMSSSFSSRGEGSTQTNVSLHSHLVATLHDSSDGTTQFYHRYGAGWCVFCLCMIYIMHHCAPK